MLKQEVGRLSKGKLEYSYLHVYNIIYYFFDWGMRGKEEGNLWGIVTILFGRKCIVYMIRVSAKLLARLFHICVIVTL